MKRIELNERICTKFNSAFLFKYEVGNFRFGAAEMERIPWLIFNFMHKILIYLYIIHLLESSTCFEHYPACAPVKKELFLNRCTGQSPADSDDTRG